MSASRGLPIWAEGMLLHQQHLQLLESDYLRRCKQLLALQHSHNWGLLKFDYDSVQLQEGVFELKKLNVIMPGGQWIDWSNRNEKCFHVKLDTSALNQTIYLGVSRNEECEALSGYEFKSDTIRWTVEYDQIADVYDSDRHAEIAIKHPKLYLSLKPFNECRYNQIALITVVQSSQRVFETSSEMIPACLSMNAVPQYREWIQQLLTRVSHRIDHLENKEPIIRIELETLKLILQQSLSDLGKHPHELIKDLQQCLTRIAVASNNALPSFEYNHEKMGELCRYLLDYSQSLLSTIKVEEYIDSTLAHQTENLWTWHKPSNRDWNDLRIIIEISVKADENTESILKQIKVSSERSLDRLISSALPGLYLNQIYNLPDQNKYQDGKLYFELGSMSSEWQALRNDDVLAIYMTGVSASYPIKLIVSICQDDFHEKKLHAA